MDHVIEIVRLLTHLPAGCQPSTQTTSQKETTTTTPSPKSQHSRSKSLDGSNYGIGCCLGGVVVSVHNCQQPVALFHTFDADNSGTLDSLEFGIFYKVSIVLIHL